MNSNIEYDSELTDLNISITVGNLKEKNEAKAREVLNERENNI